MTQQKHTRTRRPMRAILAAAALVAALGITAGAANLDVVQDFITSITVRLAGTNSDLPALDVVERDGRTYLLLDGEETDVTDALAQDGFYTCTVERGGRGYEIRVNADGSTTTNLLDPEGGIQFSFATKPEDGEGGYTANASERGAAASRAGAATAE